MTFAVIGLAFSHPYTYTQVLHRMGHRVAHAWDDDATRLAEFAARHGAAPLPAPDAIPARGIDGVIVTGRLPERIDHAVALMERGVPVYLGKPMVARPEQLQRLGEALRRTGMPLLSTSVLRFAPAIRALRRRLSEGRVGTLVAVRATSAHGIDMYLGEPHVWQDDPARGGGTLVTMGVHALDMLSALVGTQITRVFCQTGRRHHVRSLSEDVALLTLEWADGLLGTVEIIGGISGESYGVEVFGSGATLRVAIPKEDVLDHRGGAVGDVDPWEEAGYVATMAAFVEMCRTRVMPVPFAESEAVMRVLLAARRSAASGQPVRVGAVTV
jgi:predicted dehydrogenase